MRIGPAAVLISLVTATSAQAAIEVIGNRIAHACFVAAERRYSSMSAEDVCTSALFNEPLSLRDRTATLVNRGVVRVSLRNFDGALSDFNMAIAGGVHLSPTDLGVAYVNRATVLNNLERFREARDSASKGLDLGATNPEIGFYARAVAEEKLGDVTAAYHDYKRALAVAPGFMPAAEQLKRFRVVTRPAGSP